MKNDIHPKYYSNTKVSCACGNVFETGSTEPELKIDLCSACHPFYTGKQKLVDTAHRVEKFQAKIESQKTAADGRKGKKVKREERAKVKAEKEVTVKSKK